MTEAVKNVYERVNPSGALRYLVVVRVGRQRIQLTCDTLEEAIEHRDELLKRQKEAKRLRRQRIANGKHKSEVIYFIQAGEHGPIKIGRADARLVEKRLGNLQVAAHEELRLLGAIIGDSGTELRLHKRYADLRIRGEWFSETGEMHAILARRPDWLPLPGEIRVSPRSPHKARVQKVPANERFVVQ